MTSSSEIKLAFLESIQFFTTFFIIFSAVFGSKWTKPEEKDSFGNFVESSSLSIFLDWNEIEFYTFYTHTHASVVWMKCECVSNEIVYCAPMKLKYLFLIRKICFDYTTRMHAHSEACLDHVVINETR